MNKQTDNQVSTIRQQSQQLTDRRNLTECYAQSRIYTAPTPPKATPAVPRVPLNPATPRVPPVRKSPRLVRSEPTPAPRVAPNQTKPSSAPVAALIQAEPTPAPAVAPTQCPTRLPANPQRLPIENQPIRKLLEKYSAMPKHINKDIHKTKATIVALPPRLHSQFSRSQPQKKLSTKIQL